MRPTNDGHAADPVVACRGVSKTYRTGWRRRSIEALRGVDLSVGRGEIVGVLGPNGSGKTTLFKTLLGLVAPDAGDVRVLGAKPGANDAKARIGFVPEDNELHSFLTIESTLALHGRLLGLDRAAIRERTARLVSLLHLESHRGPVRSLSKGTVRKLAMAVALLGDPDLLVLDEPTSGIDPLLSREVTDEVLRRRDAGVTVVLSSHLLADVERVCDRLVVLYFGEVICEGRTEELLERDGERVLRFRDLDEKARESIRRVAIESGATDLGDEPARDDLSSFFLRLLEGRGERP